MTDWTIRNPDEMRNFAAHIEEYIAALQGTCAKLEQELAAASSYMKDDISKQAIARLEDLINQILTQLPGAQEVAHRLTKAAKPLDEARSITF